jgi:hypothetical protein
MQVITLPQAVAKKTRIVDVVYNASNNELVSLDTARAGMRWHAA